MNGRYVNLGVFNNVIHGLHRGEPLVMEHTYEFTMAELEDMIGEGAMLPLEYFIQEFLPVTKEAKDRDFVFTLEYKVELVSTKEKPSHYLRTIAPRRIHLELSGMTEDGKKIDGTSIIISEEETEGRYQFHWKRLRYPPFLEDNLIPSGKFMIEELSFVNLVPQSFRCANSNEHDQRCVNAGARTFFAARELLKMIFKRLTYLGPLREEPCRRYVYEDEVMEIGVKGENAAYIFLSDRNTPVHNAITYDSETDSFERRSGMRLGRMVDSWLSLMGIESVRTPMTDEIVRLSLSAGDMNESRVNIADVGFGVSQVFPIIIEGLRTRPGHTLILEQPEIHLHPRLQMILADFIVSLALGGKRVILETHSDHIVNRLVRRMVEDKKGELIDKTAMYFVKHETTGSEIESIEVCSKCGIVNWPKDFFDQAVTEQEHIMKAIVENKKRKK